MTDPALKPQENPWGRLAPSNEGREKIWGKNRSFAGDVWFRFRSRFNSLLGLGLILLVLLFTTLGPRLTAFTYKDQNLDYVNVSPYFWAVATERGYFYVTTNLKLIEIAPDGHLGQSVPRIGIDPQGKRMSYLLKGERLTLDYGTKPYTLLDAAGEKIERRKFFWNSTYRLGSDSLGRDMIARLAYGARVSLLVALTAAFANLVIGVLYGGVSAYGGGIVDAVMMRIVDIISALPLTLYVILIMVFLDTGFASIIIALGSVYWVNMARVVRGEILSLKERDFVLASQTIGSSPSSILFRHLIPNAMGPILVTLTMLIPQAIFMEAFLSFIGLGVAAPLASLGTMCSDAIAMLRTSPYQLFEPALLICVLMFGFNFVGDGLRDALDPKLKR